MQFMHRPDALNSLLTNVQLRTAASLTALSYILSLDWLPVRTIKANRLSLSNNSAVFSGNNSLAKRLMCAFK